LNDCDPRETVSKHQWNVGELSSGLNRPRRATTADAGARTRAAQGALAHGGDDDHLELLSAEAQALGPAVPSETFGEVRDLVEFAGKRSAPVVLQARAGAKKKRQSPK
jgi:hypothetical protein